MNRLIIKSSEVVTRYQNTLQNFRTPLYAADLNKIKKNVQKMKKIAKKYNVVLRPHVKTHKTIQGALLQTGKENLRFFTWIVYFHIPFDRCLNRFQNTGSLQGTVLGRWVFFIYFVFLRKQWTQFFFFSFLCVSTLQKFFAGSVITVCIFVHTVYSLSASSVLIVFGLHFLKNLTWILYRRRVFCPVRNTENLKSCVVNNNHGTLSTASLFLHVLQQCITV